MDGPVSRGEVRRAAWIIAGLVLAGVLLRAVVAFGVFGRMPLVSDAESYAVEATDWLAHGHPRAFYWPPGNTVLLLLSFGALGEGAFAARVATVLVSSLTVVFAAGIGGRLGGRRVAFATAATGALYVPAVLLCGQSYSQHLAGLCLVAVAYYGPLAVEEGRLHAFALGGLAFGVGAATRPSALSIAPVLVVFTVLAARSALRDRDSARASRIAVGAVCAALCAAVCVAPAVLHNRARGEGWTISTNSERNFFLGNNPYTPDYKTSHLAQRPMQMLPSDVQEYLRSFQERSSARAAMQREAMEYIAEHPLRTLYRIANRARAFWGFDYLATRVAQEHGGAASARAAPALLALEAGGFVVVMALVTCALVGLRGSIRGGWTPWLVALVLAYQAPYLIAFSGGTYHFPVMGLLWPFAALAAVRLHEEGLSWFARRIGFRGGVALGLLFAFQVEYAIQAARMASP